MFGLFAIPEEEEDEAEVVDPFTLAHVPHWVLFYGAWDAPPAYSFTCTGSKGNQSVLNEKYSQPGVLSQRLAATAAHLLGSQCEHSWYGCGSVMGSPAGSTPSEQTYPVVLPNTLQFSFSGRGTHGHRMPQGEVPLPELHVVDSRPLLAAVPSPI